jgi:hypothetical protein
MKGKQGAAAQARRDWAALTAERDEWKHRAEKAEAAAVETAKAAERILEAADRIRVNALNDLANGTSDLLRQERETVERLRQERDDARTLAETAVELRRRLVFRMHDHLVAEHRMTGTEAMERLLAWAGELSGTGDEAGPVIVHNALTDPKDWERAGRLQLARGDRKKMPEPPRAAARPMRRSGYTQDPNWTSQ